MKRVNTAKVEFYRVTIQTCVALIEERSGRSIRLLDMTIEPKLENALLYGNVTELKKLHLALAEMYDRVKKRALIA